MGPSLTESGTELDRVIGPSRLPGYEDQPNLPYVRCLIKEMSRWAPIGSIVPPHAPAADDVYEGMAIPKGTVIFANLPGLNRDPVLYGEPDEFKPERYLDDPLSSFTSAHQSDFRKRDHHTYGFGRRLCPGIHVAEASLFIIVARVLWAFEITPEPDFKPLEMADRYGE